jgi:hypothetical protein
MAPDGGGGSRSRPKHPPVGSVVEQRQGGRTFLLVHETPDTVSVIESWPDAFDVADRVLGRLKKTLEEMNIDMSAFNQRLAAGLRETDAKIKANQRLLDELIKGHP